MSESIYASWKPVLEKIMHRLVDYLENKNAEKKASTGESAFEHINYRIKGEESMRDKCRRKEISETPESALCTIHDAIGIRIVCCFLDDVYDLGDVIRNIPGVRVAKEKDFITSAKPSGYRSYHIILEIEDETTDALGNTPGHYYAEVQLRTIAMDSWASLEHQMQYKHEIKNKDLISRELKRCADELAACDVSMQTIRMMIKEA
uniref:GTP pyrophosphokinase n=1 Tax=uncultured Allisonella sp. TaxID=339338 RepID=UPI00258884FC|nr:GTP pyrophosphokinase family protein [uncultured Allisonella sp.]